MDALPRTRREFGYLGQCLLATVLAVGTRFSALSLLGAGEPIQDPAAGAPSKSTLSTILALTPAKLADIDIAQMNLLCAQGLPGASSAIPSRALATLDNWAQRAKAETEGNLYRFRRNPGDFEHSEGFFRMLMLMVVLTEDFGVHYKQGAKTAPEAARVGDGFFADPADVFLHGCLGPKRQGTCSSLPVLYVAIGRRLGYPLKLVTTRGHLLVRWEDSKERFNVEVSGQGLNRFDDAYYRKWPFPVTEEEVQAEGYLKSLTPPEELALFLSIRGMCWLEAGRKAEAVESFAAAARLAPGCRSYRRMAENLQREATAPPKQAPRSADHQSAVPPNCIRQVQAPAETPASWMPAGRFEICDTAESNSALRVQTAAPCRLPWLKSPVKNNSR